MTPKQLRECGEALYGEHWQTPLSDALGIAQRTMRRWLAGAFQMPDNLGQRIETIASARIVDATKAAKRVREILR